MPQPSTGSQRLADLLLSQSGTSLADYLATKRAQGLSYERIARDLGADTDDQVTVSYATIKRWVEDLQVAS